MIETYDVHRKGTVCKGKESVFTVCVGTHLFHKSKNKQKKNPKNPKTKKQKKTLCLCLQAIRVVESLQMVLHDCECQCKRRQGGTHPAIVIVLVRSLSLRKGQF